MQSIRQELEAYCNDRGISSLLRAAALARHVDSFGVLSSEPDMDPGLVSDLILRPDTEPTTSEDHDDTTSYFWRIDSADCRFELVHTTPDIAAGFGNMFGDSDDDEQPEADGEANIPTLELFACLGSDVKAMVFHGEKTDKNWVIKIDEAALNALHTRIFPILRPSASTEPTDEVQPPPTVAECVLRIVVACLDWHLYKGVRSAIVKAMRPGAERALAHLTYYEAQVWPAKMRYDIPSKYDRYEREELNSDVDYGDFNIFGDDDWTPPPRPPPPSDPIPPKPEPPRETPPPPAAVQQQQKEEEEEPPKQHGWFSHLVGGVVNVVSRAFGHQSTEPPASPSDCAPPTAVSGADNNNENDSVRSPAGEGDQQPVESDGSGVVAENGQSNEQQHEEATTSTAAQDPEPEPESTTPQQREEKEAAVSHGLHLVLPETALLSVLEYLAPRDLIAFSHTCKLIRSMCYGHGGVDPTLGGEATGGIWADRLLTEFGVEARKDEPLGAAVEYIMIHKSLTKGARELMDMTHVCHKSALDARIRSLAHHAATIHTALRWAERGPSAETSVWQAVRAVGLLERAQTEKSAVKRLLSYTFFQALEDLPPTATGFHVRTPQYNGNFVGFQLAAEAAPKLSVSFYYTYDLPFGSKPSGVFSRVFVGVLRNAPDLRDVHKDDLIIACILLLFAFVRNSKACLASNMHKELEADFDCGFDGETWPEQAALEIQEHCVEEDSDDDVGFGLFD